MEFAEYLRAERERRRLRLDQVADKAPIAERHLATPERGDVRSWPGGMYTRAMMRAYAESIGVDREIALRQFERAVNQPAAPDDTPAARDESASPSRRWRPSRMLATAAAALVGLAIGVSLWRIAGADRPARAAAAEADQADRTMDTPVVEATRVEQPPAGEAVTAATGRSQRNGTARMDGIARVDGAARVERPLAREAVTATSGTAAEAPAARPRASEGHLVVRSTPPGARVTVNGIGWGETPVTIHHLPLGEKRVRLTMQGYLSQEAVVRLGPERPAVTVRLTLRERESSPKVSEGTSDGARRAGRTGRTILRRDRSAAVF
ncbi:MAG: PEGA domain-containing protein [Vicinamibacterales bacterium]